MQYFNRVARCMTVARSQLDTLNNACQGALTHVHMLSQYVQKSNEI